MARGRSSGRWLREHFDDPYVQRAQREGYRSRAVYKLTEIDDKDRLLRPGMSVVDLGAAPGGWCQYAARRVGAKGHVVGLDILPIEPIPGVTLLQADFTEDAALVELERVLGAQPVDLVLSDMAPNISGMAAVDQPRSMYLAELALEFCERALKPGGDFLVKTFQGEGFDELLRCLRSRFRRVHSRKPQASRNRSREVYLLARYLDCSNVE